MAAFPANFNFQIGSIAKNVLHDIYYYMYYANFLLLPPSEVFFHESLGLLVSCFLLNTNFYFLSLEFVHTP